MTDVLHSLSVKLNQLNHLTTLGCLIEGITDVVQEVVVTPQEEVVAVVDNQEVEPPKEVKKNGQ